MALKKDGDRVKIALSVKKITAEDLRILAEMGNRPLGRMLDILVYEEMQRVRKGK